MLDSEERCIKSASSKDLVNLFHKAGHILSYDQILQVDTGLAESVLNLVGTSR